MLLMWYQLRNAAILEGFPEYARYEGLAEQIRIFENDFINGLLQTRGYVTALQMGFVRQGAATQKLAEERIEFRLARQRLLDRSSPPLLHVVLDESCLRRAVGGRDVMIEQLLHLERMSTRRDVIIQIAPFSLGEERPFTHMTALLIAVDALGQAESRAFIRAARRDLEWMST
ncbi:DUF5753 domain-containing protein [Kitasatospora sp. NPDC058162]|uniref:DUF5753 domain-containing protein n=1 Tax=Kitasatospora sp. NPDC058162 TaxID=3346362 RepID=UPI0036DCA871